MKYGISVVCVLLFALVASRATAQGEYSTVDSGGIMLFGGFSGADNTTSFGGGIGYSFKGQGDMSFHYASRNSQSVGSSQFGVLASFFLGRNHKASNLFAAIRAGVDQADDYTVVSPSLSLIYLTSSFAKTSVVPSVSIGLHSSSGSRGAYFVQAAMGIRFLSAKGSCFYLEPGGGIDKTTGSGKRSTKGMGFITIGWIG